MKILFSAYSCGPWNTSEPGVAWRAINHALSQGHEVWSISQQIGYEQPMKEHLAKHPMPNYHPVFFQLSPKLARFRSMGLLGNVYYHLWQKELIHVAQRLHEQVGFDLCHHVTFLRYWTPSGLRNLGIPFVWGPVGAAESMPASFLAELPLRDRMFEHLRDGVRAISQKSPALKDTAKKATIALGLTRESCDAMRQLGAPIEHLPLAITDVEVAALNQIPPPGEGPFRVLCLGRLLHWKGFHLAIRAFAQFAKTNAQAELSVVGGGPFESQLKQFAAETGLASRIHFFGSLSHKDSMAQLAQAHVLLHPSLHEAFGYVCLEAMAAGRPVICLDIGGPAVQVTKETGFVIPATTPGESISAMADALHQLATNRPLLLSMSEKGRIQVQQKFTLRTMGAAINAIYDRALALHPQKS